MSPKKTVSELKPHPLALIFPTMGAKEFKEFVEDIRAEGLRDAIILFEKMILDGNHRYRACLEAGIEPRFLEWDGDGSPLAFVISKNRHRRHLTNSQRAMLAGRLQTALEEEAKANMRKGRQGLANLPNRRSRDEAAKAAKVSSRLAGSAGVVLKRGTHELVASVDRGEVAVSAAAEVAKLGPEEQEKVLAGGPQAIRAKASDLRRAKKAEASATRATKGKAAWAEPSELEATSTEAEASPTPDNLAPRPGQASSSAEPARIADADARWLEGFPIRASLADTRAFDAQALFHRRTLAAYEAARREHPEFHEAVPKRLDFMNPAPLLLGATVPTQDPEAWSLCHECGGKGRDGKTPCPACRGDGFKIPPVDHDDDGA